MPNHDRNDRDVEALYQLSVLTCLMVVCAKPSTAHTQTNANLGNVRQVHFDRMLVFVHRHGCCIKQASGQQHVSSSGVDRQISHRRLTYAGARNRCLPAYPVPWTESTSGSEMAPQQQTDELPQQDMMRRSQHEYPPHSFHIDRLVCPRRSGPREANRTPTTVTLPPNPVSKSHQGSYLKPA